MFHVHLRVRFGDGVQGLVSAFSFSGEEEYFFPDVIKKGFFFVRALWKRGGQSFSSGSHVSARCSQTLKRTALSGLTKRSSDESRTAGCCAGPLGVTRQEESYRRKPSLPVPLMHGDTEMDCYIILNRCSKSEDNSS